ncbi:MAG: dTDP-4-amino-4,6-dideoxygalactose transaminase [Bacteroidia bacterium]|jgi:dTDP-4-amino-4,6-dideoxygalactose transaminase|nr:dTDP-4-amino-4,6-dideoxygalactose transaminase [Bacteroidia bacterium]
MSVAPHIPLNRPFLTGHETEYIRQAVMSGKIAGDGLFTARCHAWMTQHLQIAHPLLTTSCTDALELAALLLNIQPGDEVIVPAYTFVSTANAFVLRGAVPVFADSSATHPNMDAQETEKLITPRTRAIVPVHYAGMSCEMDTLLQLAAHHSMHIVEDAAQAIGARYKGQAFLGTLGALGTFSFHETKNVIAGEGGMLAVNDETLVARAEIIREKGTNRSAFFRGEAARYEWIGPGSSFLPSDIIAAFLYAQLEQFESIQANRLSRWQRWYNLLLPLAQQGVFELPQQPAWAQTNGNIFYLCCRNLHERDALIAHLRSRGIYAAFHYLCLHKSPYFAAQYKGPALPRAERFEQTLVRLPMYHELTNQEQDYTVQCIHDFYKTRA